MGELANWQLQSRSCNACGAAVSTWWFLLVLEFFFYPPVLEGILRVHGNFH